MTWKQYSLGMSDKTYDALRERARKLSYERGEDITWQDLIRKFVEKEIKK